MESEKNIGRTVGALVLLHLAVGLMTPFILLDHVRKSGGLLANAASNAGQMRAAVLLLFVGSALALAIAIAAWPVVRRYSAGMALWLCGLAMAGFTLQVVDNGALLSMLSVSQQTASADSAKMNALQAAGTAITSMRLWTHYTYLLVAVSWICLLFTVLLRFQLVPRLLAILGVVASLLQITGVPLRAIFGYSPEMRMAMPLAPAYVALAVWLILKGFNVRRALPEANSAHASG